MSGTLIIVRHGESEWNALGKWTGLTDVSLTDKGRAEARKAAEAIADFSIDQAFCSVLTRAKQTLAEILTTLGKSDMPVVYHPALNERDYGIYTGKNKWEIQKQVGDEQFTAIRRGYETDIPGGENLKQVCERVEPYYRDQILPMLLEGKTVLISAHSNSSRALMKILDQVPDDKASEIEIKTGEVMVYRMGPAGEVMGKDKLAVNEEAGLQ